MPDAVCSPRWMLRATCIGALAATTLHAYAMPLRAQDTRREEASSSAYLEIGGAGGFYSLNYERYIDEHLSVRVGGADWSTKSFDSQSEKLVAGIVAASARLDISDFIGRGAGRYAEAGVAIASGSHSRSSYDTIEADGPFTTLGPMIGIRYQPLNGGFMYRATFTPYVPISGGVAQFRRKAPDRVPGVWVTPSSRGSTGRKCVRRCKGVGRGHNFFSLTSPRASTG